MTYTVDRSLETATRAIGEAALDLKLRDATWRDMWGFYCSKGDVPGGMQVHRWHEQAKAQAVEQGRAA